MSFSCSPIYSKRRFRRLLGSAAMVEDPYVSPEPRCLRLQQGLTPIAHRFTPRIYRFHKVPQFLDITAKLARGRPVDVESGGFVMTRHPGRTLRHPGLNAR